VDALQTNHEGALIDRLEQRDYDGILINPGALAHTSYALHDALISAERPVVEIHVSDIRARESWRRLSVIEPATAAQVIGKGWHGYLEALDLLMDLVERKPR
jgi:3-dehydroquinate dehydratase-2